MALMTLFFYYLNSFLFCFLFCFFTDVVSQDHKRTWHIAAICSGILALAVIVMGFFLWRQKKSRRHTEGRYLSDDGLLGGGWGSKSEISLLSKPALL